LDEKFPSAELFTIVLTEASIELDAAAPPPRAASPAARSPQTGSPVRQRSARDAGFATGGRS
jgi:hypothetical protein